VLVDNLGWEWIFIVNVPIGIIGLALAVWLVPALPTTSHRFDIPGVVLSGIGMFLIVFGLQEGQGHHWRRGSGPSSSPVWASWRRSSTGSRSTATNR
jgi:MFS family permease